MSEVQTLFVKYGSKIAEGAAELFYDRMYDDPSLGTFFNGIEKHAMKEHFAAFLTDLTGGPEEYSGWDLADAHAPYDISGQAFDTLVKHLRASFIDIGVSDPDADILIAEIEMHRGKIVRN